MGGSEYMLFAIDMFTSFPSIFVITFFVLSGFFIARSLEKNLILQYFFMEIELLEFIFRF